MVVVRFKALFLKITRRSLKNYKATSKKVLIKLNTLCNPGLYYSFIDTSFFKISSVVQEALPQNLQTYLYRLSKQFNFAFAEAGQKYKMESPSIFYSDHASPRHVRPLYVPNGICKVERNSDTSTKPRILTYNVPSFGMKQ